MVEHEKWNLQDFILVAIYSIFIYYYQANSHTCQFHLFWECLSSELICLWVIDVLWKKFNKISNIACFYCISRIFSSCMFSTNNTYNISVFIK